MSPSIICIIVLLVFTLFLCQGTVTAIDEEDTSGGTSFYQSGIDISRDTSEISSTVYNSLDSRVNDGDNSNNDEVPDNDATSMQTNSTILSNSDSRVTATAFSNETSFENDTKSTGNYNTTALGNITTSVKNETVDLGNETENGTFNLVLTYENENTTFSPRIYNTTNNIENDTLTSISNSTNRNETSASKIGNATTDSSLENSTQNIENETIASSLNVENTIKNYGNSTIPTIGTPTQQPEIGTNLTTTIETYGNDNETNTTVLPTISSCSFPVGLEGDWWSTFWDQISVVGDQLLGAKIGNQWKPTTLECFVGNLSDGFIILRELVNKTSPQKHLFYTCIKFEMQNANNYHMRIKTDRNIMYSKQPIISLPINTPVDVADLTELVCNVSPSKVLEGDIIRKGKEKEGAMGCPEMLKGHFILKYTYPKISVKCPQGAEMTSCKKPDTLSFDYSSCNDTTDFPNNDEQLCVTRSSATVTLFNLQSINNNNVDPFKCWLYFGVKGDPNYLSITKLPAGCGDKWGSKFSTKYILNYFLSKTGDCVNYTSPTPVPVAQSYYNTTDRNNQTGDFYDSASLGGPSTLLMTITILLFSWITSLGL